MILFCGDPHGRFDHIVAAAKEHRPSAVILLGDIEARRPLDEELGEVADITWYIHGNHDTDKELYWNNLWGSRMACRNVHGKVVQLPNGMSLAGLGGVFRQTIWVPRVNSVRSGVPVQLSPEQHARCTPRQDRWNGGQTLRHWSSIYPSHFEDLCRAGGADILITHEAPGYHRLGFSALDRLARDLRVFLAVHGHHHDDIDSSARWGVQGFGSFGVGMRGISLLREDLTWHRVKDGEEDKALPKSQAGSAEISVLE